MAVINIFKDNQAKRKFSELYHGMDEKKQAIFGRMIREKADSKATRLDLIDDFYITVEDVLDIYNYISNNVK